MKKDVGLYIHIPFCKAKCYYCDFVSFANKEDLKKEYVEAVIKEIKYRKLDKYNIKTMYIGGGTPSTLDSTDISKIIDEVKENLDKNAEITIEVNPGTVNKEKLEAYKNIGINRLSIGLQSTDDKLLKGIGRIHTYNEFLETYKSAREVGLNNINVDLMLGLPMQKLGTLKKSLREVIKLNPEHISVYSLILEENTKLYDKVDIGELVLPNEKLEREMYWQVKNTLESKGYIHYEISNFAKKGYESKHNSDCWKQKEYIGIGVAAHSYMESKRFSNQSNLEEYINNIKSEEYEKNIIIQEEQTKEDKQKEYMLLGLRTIDGINIGEYKNKFGENPIFKFHKELDKLVGEKLLEVDGEHIKLTKVGLDLANIVWEEFV